MSSQAEMPDAEGAPRRRGGKRGSRRSRPAEPATVETATPRTGAKRTLVDVIKQLPDYLRLLGGLLTDRRVSGVDKLLVAGAVFYIIAPMDLLPDFVPFLGEVDDVYLLMLALQRLIANAGRRVVADYWVGSLADLNTANLRRVLLAATFFLPRRMRRRLRAIGRG
ncbi:MAG: YkvA family protein [Gemmatimonadaceae bacterium]